jgi:hypothetical protein
MAGPRSVITEGAPNTAQVHTREQIVNELAAVALALLDKREERTKANKSFNSAIKDLEKRQRDLATTVRSSGIRDTIQMNFASVKPQVATETPEDDDENEGEGGN